MFRVIESKRILVDINPANDSSLVNSERRIVQGVPVVIYPHTYDIWRELTANGHNVPSPLYQYPFPGDRKPWDHQVKTVEFLIRHDRCFCLNDLGTGKSLSVIWALDYLRSVGAIRRALIIAPLSITKHVWQREIKTTIPTATVGVIEGTKAQKQAIAEDMQYDWLVVNPDSVHLIVGHLPQVDLVVVDEFTAFKTWRTRRTRALAKIAASTKLWMLSGTPAPQAPTDAVAPIRLVTQQPLSFRRFRELTMEQKTQYKWEPRPEAPEVVARYMQPAIRYARDDCYSIPGVSTINQSVDVTAQQQALLKELYDTAAATIDATTITAANAAAVLSKALQILSGVVYDADKNPRSVDASPMFEVVESIIDQSNTPVLVFGAFRAAVERLAQYLIEKEHRVGMVLGGVKGKSDIFDALQAGELDAVVAVPSTMSHGLTLTAASTIIWTVPPFSVETYQQANGRIVRPGQKNKVIIYHLTRNHIDRELFSRLKTRTRLQDVVLKLIAGYIQPTSVKSDQRNL
jgi:SNF2 family DNA or RNA helicase